MVGASSCRIIPARAGFTLASTSATRPRWDHPRSRGVYVGGEWAGHWCSGSSPLARGLLPVGHAGEIERRIIPARAGFTSDCQSTSASSPDHPRSRGVYAAALPLVALVVGSSPLARGLPRAVQCSGTIKGIIPARAGFTIFQHPTDIPPGDHPRSRGVYAVWTGIQTGAQGSSPLARGLPRPAGGGCQGGRIIPARAGFTAARIVEADREQDHPRSRGVYPPYPHAATDWNGSSPLARGLHHGN